MLAAIEKLLIVQDRDRQIAQLRRDLSRLPQERADADIALAATNAALDAAKNDLKTEEVERKKLEIEAEGKRTTVNKYKTQLNLIKSNVEYQALLKEIVAGEEEVHQIEDRELEMMEQAELLQRQIREKTAEAKAVAERTVKLKADLDARGKVIRERLAALEGERAGLTKEVDETTFERYERILRSKGDMAVAAIEHESCSGCHLHLPPDVVHIARSGAEIATCGNCGRILYWSGN